MELTDFCSKEARFDLDKPCVRENRKFYTNGKVLVWEDNVEEEETNLKHPDFTRFLKDWSEVKEFYEVDKIDYEPKIITCPDCSGNGYITCDTCTGSGNVDCSHCGYEGYCIICEGEGKLDKCDCENGKTLEENTVEIIEGLYFSANIFYLLQQLEGCKFSLPQTDDERLYGKWGNGGFLLIVREYIVGKIISKIVL